MLKIKARIIVFFNLIIDTKIVEAKKLL